MKAIECFISVLSFQKFPSNFLEVGFCALDPKMQLAISQRDYADLMNTLACSKTESITRDLRF